MEVDQAEPPAGRGVGPPVEEEVAEVQVLVEGVGRVELGGDLGHLDHQRPLERGELGRARAIAASSGTASWSGAWPTSSATIR